MRSAEVARLAGVSTRTLRHYHQVGILVEPDRDPNGYRRYELHHLARLLRIRRVVALGVSLDRVPEIIDKTDEGHAELYDTLDDDVRVQIERLQRLREQIAELRLGRRRPDVPAGPAPFADVVGHGVTADLEYDALLVLNQVARDLLPDDLTRLGSSISERAGSTKMAELIQQFDGLDPDTPEDQTDKLAQDFVDLVGESIANFVATPSGQRLDAAAANIPGLVTDPRLSPAQTRLLNQITGRLNAHISSRNRRPIAPSRQR